MLAYLRWMGVVVLVTCSAAPAQVAEQSSQSNSSTDSCNSPQSQLELNECTAARYRKADARLNTVYGTLMHHLQSDLTTARSANKAEDEKYSDKAIQLLKSTEKMWIQYRDLHCEAAGHQYEGGSLRPTIWANCMTEVTNHRIDELKSAYESPDFKLE